MTRSGIASVRSPSRTGSGGTPRRGRPPRARRGAGSSPRRAREYDGLPIAGRPTVAEWWDAANDAWVAETCALVGVDAPATRRERIAAGEHALAV